MRYWLRIAIVVSFGTAVRLTWPDSTLAAYIVGVVFGWMIWADHDDGKKE